MICLRDDADFFMRPTAAEPLLQAADATARYAVMVRTPFAYCVGY